MYPFGSYHTIERSSTITYQNDFTLPAELLEQIASEGLDFLPELVRILINAATQIDREKYLGAGHFECTPERRGHANGFKPKTVKTRLGEITFDVAQVRDSRFYPDALEKGLRSERALTLTLAEMYVQSVSTRWVKKVIEQMCGTTISSSQVRRAGAGAALLAMETGVPLVPIGFYVEPKFIKEIKGHFHDRDPVGWWQFGGKCNVNIGEPWQLAMQKKTDRSYRYLRELTDKLMNNVQDLVNQAAKSFNY